MDSKRIGVTSLTFHGYVTPSVSEIFNGECDAMVDMTLNDL